MLNTDTINKLRSFLKGFITSGCMSQDEFSEIIKTLRDASKKKKDASFKDEQLTQSDLAKRWKISTRQVKRREERGDIRKIQGIRGYPRFWLSNIIKYEEGE